ncbi:MAG: GyrI-like domain-containing protein [Bacteroidetes bacterium]|nr:GyrI-like domain-containing protein [Bacteroidota bacterium]
MKQATALHIIGIAIRTTNENGQSAKDIPALWNEFLSGNKAAGIPGKTSNDIYCVYTDYEKDYTRPYTTVLGCAVHSLENIPAGYTGITIPAGNYQSFTTSGNILEGIVFNTWQTIWNTPIDRAYIADFEVYGARAANPSQAEVDIFVGIK